MRVTVLTNWLNGIIGVWQRGPDGGRIHCLAVLQTRSTDLQQQVRAGLVDPPTREMNAMAEDLVTMLSQLGHDAILEHLT